MHFLEDNNNIVALQNGGRGSEWFAAEETRCRSASRKFLNVDKVDLYTKGNV